MTKKAFCSLRSQKGEDVVQISGFARNLNHFPLFSHERSECEKAFTFFVMYLVMNYKCETMNILDNLKRCLQLLF